MITMRPANIGRLMIGAGHETQMTGLGSHRPLFGSRHATATLTLRCRPATSVAIWEDPTLQFSISISIYSETSSVGANDAPAPRLYHDVLNSYLHTYLHTDRALIAPLHLLHSGIYHAPGPQHHTDAQGGSVLYMCSLVRHPTHHIRLVGGEYDACQAHTAQRAHTGTTRGILQYNLLCSGAISLNYAEHISAELGRWAGRWWYVDVSFTTILTLWRTLQIIQIPQNRAEELSKKHVCHPHILLSAPVVLSTTHDGSTHHHLLGCSLAGLVLS